MTSFTTRIEVFYKLDGANNDGLPNEPNSTLDFKFSNMSTKISRTIFYGDRYSFGVI